MLTAILLALLVLAAIGAAIYLVGGRDFQRGRIRTLRRIRTWRRRTIGPRIHRLEHIAVRAWTRPERTTAAAHVRRIAARIDHMSVAAERFSATERRLGDEVTRLEKLATGDPRPGTGPSRRVGRPAPFGWVQALLLGLAGLALAAGNGFVLYRYVIPVSPTLPVIPSGVDAVTVSLTLAALPFLFGVAYYALYASTKALTLRLLAGLAMLMVLALALVEATLLVLTVTALGLADPGAWDGVATALLAGGIGALVPALVAVLAHRSVLAADHWASAQSSRTAYRKARRGERVGASLRVDIDRMLESVSVVRGELQALQRDPAGRLLLQPDNRHTVERASAVLRRLAELAERDVEPAWGGQGRAAGIGAGFFLDVMALIAWIAAAAAALSLSAQGLREGAELGITGLLTAGAFASVGALLLSGLGLRRLFSAPGIRLGPAGRAVGVLLLGLAVASGAALFGSLVASADGGVLDGRPVMAAAWINLLFLVAAALSTQLGAGVTAAAALLTWGLALILRLVLGALDLGLAVGDWLLGGRPRSGPPRSRTRPRPAHEESRPSGAGVP